ncbi:apolipoprotein L1 isoform X2 [Hypomesus transpacificus]|uniref:apolipoprotein L1 isoform X2 n=1 Tax=Hypomesus transpacificus TaxID=137520 RepID=UPI001F07B8AB|nr:apolipoprotein L1 isoform X2 [Hypomesus transpacificus]
MERKSLYNTLDLDLECDGAVKEKGGMFSSVFKRSSKSTEPSSTSLQDNSSVHSNDSLSDNNKEKGGMLKGLFKKTSEPSRDETHRPTQPTLTVEGDAMSVDSDLSGSSDGLSGNNTNEKRGVFSGMFKKSPKPLGRRFHSQDDVDSLPAQGDVLGSSDSLTENTSKGGVKPKIRWNPFSSSPNEKNQLTSEKQSRTKQDYLSVQNDLSASSVSLSETTSKDKLPIGSDLSTSSGSLSETTSKGGVMGKIFWNPFSSTTRDEDRAALTTDSSQRPTSTEKLSKTKQERDSDSDAEEKMDDCEQQSSSKQTKLVGAMTKLNLFRSAAPKQDNETRTDSEEPPASSEKPSSHKQNVVVGAMSKLNPFRSAPKVESRNLIQQGQKERSAEPEIPPRPTEEELKGTVTWDKLMRREAEDSQASRNMIPRERAGIMIASPEVPTRPTEEELNRSVKGGRQKHKKANQDQSDDEVLKEGQSVSTREQNEEEKDGEEEEVNPSEGKKVKQKKPKRHNPFMPRGAAKAKTMQKNTEGQQGAKGRNSAENVDGTKSLFDKLEEFRVDRSENESDQDVEHLMEWWNTVEQWEDMAPEEDLTEKEEAKAFALTAEKVQKGIRVFNKLFSERAESLWQHVIDLNTIADGLDRFNKNTKIAQITGGSTSAIGGVATIAGLALAPVTFGTSLIVTAVGLGIATAGGLTSAGAGISNQVNNSLDRKKVEHIVEDYQEKMADINKCMKFIKQGIENLRKFDVLKIKNHGYNKDFPGLNNIYEDGAMAGKAILINANEIMRVVQIANVAGSTAARAVQIASMATGVLTGLFVGMDIYFVAKDSKELKKGAKSEFAAKIREVALQLHEGLVELNGIREELQSANTPDNANEGADSLATEKAKTFDDNNDNDDELCKKKNEMADEGNPLYNSKT